MPVAELDGLEIAYDVVGDGPAWVLTPGGRIALFTSARGRTLPLRVWDGFVGERLTGQRMFEHDEVTGALRERGYVDVQQLTTGITQFVGGRKAQ